MRLALVWETLKNKFPDEVEFALTNVLIAQKIRRDFKWFKKYVRTIY